MCHKETFVWLHVFIVTVQQRSMETSERVLFNSTGMLSSCSGLWGTIGEKLGINNYEWQQFSAT